MSVQLVDCQCCGKEFRPRRKGNKYCGIRCRERYWHWRKRGHDSENPKYTKPCRQCGIEIRTNDQRKAFCSARCNVAFQNAKRKTTKTQTRECPVCATEFQPMQKRGVGRTYCSAKCRSKANYERQRPHQSGRHEEWRKKNKWDGNWWGALQRDEFTCQLCERQSFPSQWRTDRSKLVVHHLDGTGERANKNHELENLMTVCQPCHRLFHQGVNLVFIDGRWCVEGAVFAYLALQNIPTIWRDDK